MKTFRQFMAIMALMMALCIVPCLLPAEIPENRAQIECGAPVRAQQDSDVVVDISACQNACRMRYGPTPPTGHSATDDGVGETEKNPGATVEQSSPALYYTMYGRTANGITGNNLTKRQVDRGASANLAGMVRLT